MDNEYSNPNEGEVIDEGEPLGSSTHSGVPRIISQPSEEDLRLSESEQLELQNVLDWQKDSERQPYEFRNDPPTQ
jgi:hypothetical protein